MRNDTKAIRILTGAAFPGGANALAPVIKALSGKYNIELLSSASATTCFKKNNLAPLNLGHSLSGYVDKFTKLFSNGKYALVLSALCSESNSFEAELVSTARRFGLPTIMLMEYWTAIGCLLETHAQPDLVCVIDEYSKTLVDAIPGMVGKTRVTGQPWYDGLIQDIFNPDEKKNTRRLVGVPNDAYLISFMSQPVAYHYLDKRGQSSMGYTEHTILLAILDALKMISANRNIYLLIKLHPRDIVSDFDYLKKINSGATVVLDANYDHRRIMYSSDLVLGMFSSAIVEAVYMRKPVLSIQIGLRVKNPCIFTGFGYVKTITVQDELTRILEKVVVDGDTSEFDKMINTTMSTAQNATNNIVRIIERMVGNGSI